MFVPYAAIGICVALVFGIWALIEAESNRGRIFVVVCLIIFLLLPVFWRTGAGRLAQLVGGMIFGIGCYIFIRWRGYGIR